MITTDNSGMVMPVGPMNYGMNGSWGNGDNLWWIIILLLFANGNWGNNWGGNGMMPWMMGTNTNNDVQRGFDQQALTTGISGVANAVNGIGNQICNSTAGITSAVNNGFAIAESAANARQMADMQQNFALQQQLSQCCCDNRLATANLTATVLAENCSDRAALSDGIRDILVNQTANTQRLVDTTNQAVQGVYDKLCQLELNAKDNTIAELRERINRAEIGNMITASANMVEQYVNPTPIPAYPVQNPNCCPNNYYNTACGCNR